MEYPPEEPNENGAVEWRKRVLTGTRTWPDEEFTEAFHLEGKLSDLRNALARVEQAISDTQTPADYGALPIMRTERERIVKEIGQIEKALHPPQANPPSEPAVATDPWVFLPANEPYRARVIAICRGAAWIIANKADEIKHGKSISASKIGMIFLDHSFKWWDEARLDGPPYTHEKTAEWILKWVQAGFPNPDIVRPSS
ncbi:MAG: hypothetical protein H7838_09925 [Magnetococcus sp. DMHC-8]